MTPIEAFDTRDQLADAAADILGQTLAAPGAQTLVVPGGSTPGPVFDRLARRDLAWERLTVTLTDERWVDPDSDLSNEHLVRQRLLVGAAARAAFVKLRGDNGSPEADAAGAESRVRAVLPFTVVLLGMGPDGHVASLFPGSPMLKNGLDLDGPRFVVAVDKAGLDPLVPRITLTAHALVRTALLLLLISGDEKRGVIERIASNIDYAPPAATILRQDRCPVRVIWAP